MKKGHFLNSRWKDIISLDAFNELDKLVIKSQKQPFPLSANVFFSKSRGANLLTQIVLWQLRYNNHYCYRNSSQGTARKINGKLVFTPGSKHAKGQGDVFAVVNQKATFIEVKFRNDPLSNDQEKFKAGIEKSGGVYLVVRSFDSFMEQYKQLLINN